MGREIRMVPANWEHPRNESGEYKPLKNDYDKAMARFKEHIEKHGLEDALEDYGGGPLRYDYADYEGKACEWFQLYETVSEGTPVTPPFQNKQDLIEYLVSNGDEWAQRRGSGGLSRKAAENLVNGGWAPSMIISNGRLMNGAEGLVS